MTKNKRKQMTVKELRQSGYKVAVKHVIKTHAQGGFTTVKLRNPEGREVIDAAICSDKDQYNKKLGVKIALGRALKQLGKAKKGE